MRITYLSLFHLYRQSYDVEIEVVVEGTGVSAKNVLDLKNPFFRYTGIQTVAPPGNHSQSPTDAYWGNAGVVLNGGVLSNAVGSYGSTQGSGKYFRFNGFSDELLSVA